MSVFHCNAMISRRLFALDKDTQRGNPLATGVFWINNCGQMFAMRVLLCEGAPGQVEWHDSAAGLFKPSLSAMLIGSWNRSELTIIRFSDVSRVLADRGDLLDGERAEKLSQGQLFRCFSGFLPR